MNVSYKQLFIIFSAFRVGQIQLNPSRNKKRPACSDRSFLAIPKVDHQGAEAPPLVLVRLNCL